MPGSVLFSPLSLVSRGQKPYFRAGECYARRDLAGLLKAIADMERSREPEIEILREVCFYAAVLAGEQRRSEIVVANCLKTLKLQPSQERKKEVYGLLISTREPVRAMEERDRNQITHQIENCFRRLQPALAQAEPLDRRAWLTILENFLPLKYLDVKEQLALRLFEEAADPREKGMIAESYLLNARRRELTAPGSADKPRARAMATFILEQAPGLFSDSRTCEQEYFHTFIFDLLSLGLADLVDRAIEMRRPESDDPIRECLRIVRLAEHDPSQALEAILRLPPENAGPPAYNITLVREINRLKVVFLAASLNNRLVSIDGTALPLPDEDRLVAEYYSAPRRQRLEALKLIRAIRARLFRELMPLIKKNFFFVEERWLDGVTATAQGTPGLRTYLQFEPGGGALFLYMPAITVEGYVRVKFPFNYDEDHRPIGINPQAVFDGPPGGDQDAVPFVWEFLALRACLRGEDGELRQQLVDGLTADINALQVARAEEAFTRLAEEAAKNETLLAGQVELANRLLLGRRIIEEFAFTARPGVYQLTGDDPLHVYFSRLEIDLQGDRLSGRLIFNEGGGELQLQYSDWRQLLLTDEEGAGLLDRYIRELVLSALIRIGSNSRGRKVSPHPAEATAYLLESDLPCEDRGYASLSRIYSRYFLGELRKPGGLARQLFYVREPIKPAGKDEGMEKGDGFLYKPLLDQSPAGRAQAIAKYGEAGVFIKTEPEGAISRLPVKEVWVDGHKVIAPLRRNPVRLQQQELMNEGYKQLPDYAGIYVITYFDNPKIRIHITRVAIHRNVDRVLEMFDGVRAAVKKGDYQSPDKLLNEETRRSVADAIRLGLTSGSLHIVSQSPDMFHPIQTTYRCPEMTSLAALREHGFVLE
jgi:hypothetical protein